MRWSSFLASAVILTVVSVASADDFGRFQPTRLSRAAVSNPFQAPAADYYAGSMRAGSFTDYPAYPIGFTNYRGLGFWGTCCEKNPPCTDHVWDGYCAQKGCKGSKGCQGRGACQKPKHRGPKLFGGCCLFDHRKLQRHFACKPDWCCYPQCASSCCGGVGANWWPVTPTCRERFNEPLCCKLRRFRNQCNTWLGKSVADDCCNDCQAQHAPSPTMAVPQPAEQPSPTLAEPKPQLPAPETSSESSDDLPPLAPLDKSARRLDFRRLPAISITY